MTMEANGFLTIPKTAKAAVLRQYGSPIKIEELDVPQPKELASGQALVKICFTGVCHSDVSNSNNIYDNPAPLPMIAGHEGAGIIVAIGAGTETGFKIGDRVGIKFIADCCLSCEMCRRGHESSCFVGTKKSGIDIPGTFQKYTVSYTRYLTPIPDGLELSEAAPVLCAGVTVLRGIKEANLTAMNWVAIPGAGGGLGHVACQYAIALGYRVVAIDTGEAKKALCEGYGATFVDFAKVDNLVDAVKKVTDGRGPHAAIVSANTEMAYSQARDYLRDRGTLVMLGLPAHANLTLPILSTALRGIKVAGCFVGNRQDAVEALDFHANGRAKLKYEVEKMENINEIFSRLHSGKVAGRIVLDLWA